MRISGCALRYPPLIAAILCFLLLTPAMGCVQMPSPEMQRLDSFRRQDPEQAIAIATRRLREAGPGPSLDRVQLYSIIAFARGNESRKADTRMALDTARRELSLLPPDAASRVLNLLFAEIEYDADVTKSDFEHGLRQLDAVLTTVARGSKEWACLLKARAGFEFHLEKADLAVMDALTAYRVAKTNGWDDVAAFSALELADAYRHAGLWSAASQMLADATLYLKGNNLTYWVSMAEYSAAAIDVGRGQWQAAFEAFDRSAELQSKLGDHLGAGLAAIFLCGRLLDAGLVADAESRCPKNAEVFLAAERNDLVTRLAFDKARIALAENQYGEALATFDDIAKNHLDDLTPAMLPVFYQDRASALAHFGRDREARIDLERSIADRSKLNEAAQARAAAILSGIQRSDALQAANERLDRENRDRQGRQLFVESVAFGGVILAGLLSFLLRNQIRHRRELGRQATILTTLTSNLSDTVLLVDSNLRVQFANRSLRVGSGPPVGAMLADVVPDSDASHFTAAVSAVVSSREPSEFDSEWRVGGMMRHYEQCATPVLDGDTLVGVTIRSSDATARRDLETALRLQARILDTMNEGVLVLDECGRITVANAAMHVLLGAPMTSLVGTSLQSRLAGDGTTSNATSLISGLGAAHGEVTLMRDDESLCLLAVTTAALDVNGERVIVWACRDITWQRRVERELLGAAGRDALSAATSLHEGLAQELAGLSLFLGSTVRQPQSEQVAGTIKTVIEYLTAAISSAKDLAQLISPMTPVRGSVGAALRALCEESAMKIGMPVEYDETSHSFDMSTATGDQICRIVAEALAASSATQGFSGIRVRAYRSDANFNVDVRWSLVQVAERNSQFFVRDLQLDMIAYRARLLGGRCAHGRREDSEFLVVTVPGSIATSNLTGETMPLV